MDGKAAAASAIRKTKTLVERLTKYPPWVTVRAGRIDGRRTCEFGYKISQTLVFFGIVPFLMPKTKTN